MRMLWVGWTAEPLQDLHTRTMRTSRHTRTHTVTTYITSCESNHGEEDDAQFGLWHLGTHCSKDGHDGTRLQV